MRHTFEKCMSNFFTRAIFSTVCKLLHIASNTLEHVCFVLNNKSVKWMSDHSINCIDVVWGMQSNESLSSFWELICNQ